ncbi:ABC transporter permease [Streptomyces blattellae]|uniref:ABC transporter permease n=1 Tax=Streptomyces blattellae TaxID=2569855 RepID=UPI001E3995D4|nr:ABC transporter permease [Streptomyces blattellae]
MKRFARLRSVAVSLLVPVVALVLWWVLSADNSSPFYPSLETILTNFRETWLFERAGSDVVPSLTRLALGYLLAVAVGIPLGALLGRVRVVHLALQPAIQFARSIPATGLVPVSIVLLGIGDTPKIVLIAFVCVFPILLNTVDGVRGVERGLEDVGQTFRLTRRQRIFAIHLPSAAPQIFAGMRLSLSIAFIMMIVTEMMGATSGLGFVTLTAQQSFQIPLMWSGMILLGVLGALLNALFVLVERRVLRWHYLSTGRMR